MTRINYRVFTTYMRICRLLRRAPTTTDLRAFAADPDKWLQIA